MNELTSNLVTADNEANNWGFILFFICFFITVSIISSRKKFLLSMFSRLYRNKERHSMFYETVTYETLNKLLLTLQTIILLSIIVYCCALREMNIPAVTMVQILVFLGQCCLILAVFVLYKFLTYSVLGAVFFKRDTVVQWNEDFFSLLSINGILLFFPTLILFYVDSAYTFCVVFLVLYLFFNLFFLFYKIYVLFFQGKRQFLYFILYLCAQEIIPLYLVYRIFVFLITQKDTIWM